MLSDELRRVAADACKRLATTASESFILFVRERARSSANHGQMSFTIALTSLPWSEAQMNASMPALKEDGLNASIEYVASNPLEGISSGSLGFGSRPKELKVSW